MLMKTNSNAFSLFPCQQWRCLEVFTAPRKPVFQRILEALLSSVVNKILRDVELRTTKQEKKFSK